MRRLPLAAMLCAILAGPAIPQGVPTIDTQSVAQDIRQLQQMLEDFGVQTDQLDTLVEQLGVVQRQLDRIEEIRANVTGVTDVVAAAMGGGLDGLLSPEFADLLALARQVQAGDWSGLIGDAAPQMRTQMEEVLGAAGFDEDTLREMATGPDAGARRTATQASTGAAVSAAARNAHAEAAQSAERIDRLVGMIAEMETLKESIDHNTRVTAELGLALARLWELEAVQTAGAGQAGVLDAAAIAEERRYLDFTLPEMGGGR